MIARLDSTAFDSLRKALPRFTHDPLGSVPHLSLEQRRAHWLDEIRKSLEDESSIAFASVVSGRINGLIVHNDSPWDSQITGRHIGTLKHIAVAGDAPSGGEILFQLIDELTQCLAKHRTQCVACRVNALDLPVIHALEQRGFLLMDTLLDFVFDFSGMRLAEITLPRSDKQLKIRLAKPDDLADLMAINKRAFFGYFGRYHADPHTPPGSATSIYVEWIRSAFQGRADWIVVAEVDGKIAGCGLWRKALKAEKNLPGVAYCDMVVVDPKFQSHGLGTALMLEGMQIARGSAQHLVGPVHVCNYPVQRTLQKLGWRICGARHAFHKWLPSGQ
jgi:ribosomal protein S18 acetylase RimI-like enzyme